MKQKTTPKTTYKIIIACIITAIVSVGATLLVMNYEYKKIAETAEMLCKDNAAPDEHGCCPGETYTDMGNNGYNCCPDSGGDCFPPIETK